MIAFFKYKPLRNYQFKETVRQKVFYFLSIVYECCVGQGIAVTSTTTLEVHINSVQMKRFGTTVGNQIFFEYPNVLEPRSTEQRYAHHSFRSVRLFALGRRILRALNHHHISSSDALTLSCNIKQGSESNESCPAIFKD